MITQRDSYFPLCTATQEAYFHAACASKTVFRYITITERLYNNYPIRFIRTPGSQFNQTEPAFQAPLRKAADTLRTIEQCKRAANTAELLQQNSCAYNSRIIVFCLLFNHFVFVFSTPGKIRLHWLQFWCSSFWDSPCRGARLYAFNVRGTRRDSY